LRPLVLRGKVTVVPMPAFTSFPDGFEYVDQDIVGQHCMQNFENSAEWLGILDADEYLVVNSATTPYTIVKSIRHRLVLPLIMINA
jgi:hypothetical protein